MCVDSVVNISTRTVLVKWETCETVVSAYDEIETLAVYLLVTPIFEIK